MTGTNGRRRPPRFIGGNPYSDDHLPGDYWQILSRKTGKPLDVRNPEDQYWGQFGYEGNLTGTVWGFYTPFDQYGMVAIHTVREEADGTISVRPGDGSSNSILVTGPGTKGPDSIWHGYIEHGVWSEC